MLAVLAVLAAAVVVVVVNTHMFACTLEVSMAKTYSMGTKKPSQFQRQGDRNSDSEACVVALRSLLSAPFRSRASYSFQ